MSRVKRQYKGYEIEATVFPLQAGGFSVTVTVIKHGGYHVDETLFEPRETFKTENEGLEGGIRVGQQQIDAGFTPKLVIS